MESTSENDTSLSDISRAGAAGLANPRLWVVSETSSQGMNPQFREPARCSWLVVSWLRVPEGADGLVAERSHAGPARFSSGNSDTG